jgi:hypothetical protein
LSRDSFRDLEKALPEVARSLTAIGTEAPVQNKVLVNLRAALLDAEARGRLALDFEVLHLSEEDEAVLAVHFRESMNRMSEALAEKLEEHTCRVRPVTEQILGRCPTGIKRALGHLPSSVLAPDNYRRLVELLTDPKAAKLLHHARFINDTTIKNLHNLPAPLRHPLMFDALDECHETDGFSDGLRWLVSRGAVSSFDALVRELAFACQSGQLLAKLKHLVEGLPLPNALPPMRVGNASRIDQAVAIRTLAKSWHNCLANYVTDTLCRRTGRCPSRIAQQETR